MLSLKQKKFCEEYVISGNATEAAKKAGYSEKTARSQGAENLTKPDIQKYIQELTRGPQTARIATGEEVLEFFTEVMKNGKVGWKDRIRAAENLAKRHGIDKPESNGGTEQEGQPVFEFVFEDVSMKGGKDEK